MTMIRAILAVAVAAATLSGCLGSGPDGGGPMGTANRGLEGEWISTDGVAISRFSGGVFETVATDTGNKLSDGSYHQTHPNMVAITVRSLIRGTTSNVNCALAGPTQLNCTSSTGQQFVLMRRGAPA